MRFTFVFVCAACTRVPCGTFGFCPLTTIADAAVVDARQAEMIVEPSRVLLIRHGVNPIKYISSDQNQKVTEAKHERVFCFLFLFEFCRARSVFEHALLVVGACVAEIGAVSVGRRRQVHATGR